MQAGCNVMAEPAGSEQITGEVVPTPDARKPHAALVKQGTRILFMFPVDTPREGEKRIGEALALLEELRGARRPDSAADAQCL